MGRKRRRKLMPIFEFKKIDNKWQVFINSKTAVYFYTTYGFPCDMFVKEVNNLSTDKKLSCAVASWNYLKLKE